MRKRRKVWHYGIGGIGGEGVEVCMFQADKRIDHCTLFSPETYILAQ